MTDETRNTPVEDSGPGAMPGSEEPSADAQVAAAEQPLPEPSEDQAEAPADDEAAKYLALAQRTQADFENYRKRAARENAAAADRGMAKLAKELLPALDPAAWDISTEVRSREVTVPDTDEVVTVRDSVLVARLRS